MSELQKMVAGRLIATATPLINLDIEKLIFVLMMFLSHLEKRRGHEFLTALNDAVHYRVEYGDWPQPNSNFTTRCTSVWIAPCGLQFSLCRRWRGNHQYWYFYKSLANGKQFFRYVGRVQTNEKCQQLYEEYKTLNSQINQKV